MIKLLLKTKGFSFSSFTLIFSIFFTFNSFSQDFNVQHIQDDVTNSGGTNTSFTAVSSTTSAFALPTNNRKTHAGRSDGNTGALEGDDMAGARVLTGTGTLTYYRESGSISNNMRFNTDIWEYTGTSGGANEFIVRGRYTATLSSGGSGSGFTFANIDVSGAGIASPNKVVPIITGIMNDDTNNGADSATGIAHLTSSTNLIVRKGTSSNNVTIYVTLVEFTGSNWTVLHGDTTSTANTGSITLYDGYDATGTATDVSDWSNSLILTQSKAQTSASGGELEKIRSQWPLMVPGADDQTVDWSWDTSRVTTSNSNRHFIHILNNPNITVSRFTNSSYAAGETTIDITSAGLTDLAQSSIIGSFITAGNGAGYAQGFRNYYLNSTTQAAHWCAKSGNSAGVSHNIQIVNFTAATPTATVGPGGVVDDMEMWLKADTGAETTGSVAATDTDPVIDWTDQGIEGNNAISSGTGDPTYTDNVFNFNPVVDFNGNHLLITPASGISSTDNMTVFVVAEGQKDPTDTYVKQLLNLAGGGSNIILDYEINATPTFSGRATGLTNTGTVTTPIPNGTPFIANYNLYSGIAPNESELFINGTSIGTAAVDTYASGAKRAYLGNSNINRRWDGGIAEMVIYNDDITSDEQNQIESYFAIKYGFTLGANGTSQDYVDSNNTTIWDVAANSGYNYNVTGIGQDNDSGLNQKQSKSILATNDGTSTDDITVGIIDISASNSANTNSFFDDDTFLIWGNDNGAITATTDITKDFSSSISGVSSSVSATPIVRKWKMVSKDSVPTLKISIPEAMVSATNPGGEDYIMIIADDASFTTNVTSATMVDVGTDLEVDFYIEGTKYITFGSAPEVAVGSRSAYFNNTGTTDTYFTAGDVNDLHNTDFTISAWVRRDTGEDKFDVLSKRDYYDERTTAPIFDGYYTHGYAFRINKTGEFRMVWRDPADSSNQSLQTTATIPENEWHHIAATFDIGTNMCSLYIDGFLEDFDDTLDPMEIDSDAHFMIGAAQFLDRQQKVRGSIDEVRVWDAVLSADQIRYIMNQEIENNGGFADGKILPSATTKNEIISIPWGNLIAYYPMSNLVFGSVKDESNSGNDMSMINYSNLDEQTAPLPYITSGVTTDWDTDTTWVNGNVQYLPGVASYLDATETIDYNIVQINHDITLDNSNTTLIPAGKNGNRTILGLVVSGTGDLEVTGNTATNTGYGLTVSHYLELDGVIDLEGESQLIQTSESDLDITSAGYLERDQQGTANSFTYNYWSSPVSLENITANNQSFNIEDVLLDGQVPNGATRNISFGSSYVYADVASIPDPIQISSYWLWRFVNTGNDYANWDWVGNNSYTLNVTEGFTMKGVSSTSAVSDEQNYVFKGKPNNVVNGATTLVHTTFTTIGDITLTGNPFPSALDADIFIDDNTGTITNSITGTLYFWEHWSDNTHFLLEYQGGYATYTTAGGVAATSHPDIASGGATGNRPGQFIPVGQGFFVEAANTQDVVFTNSQRVFEKEGVASSVFLRQENSETSQNDNERKINTNKKTPPPKIGQEERPNEKQRIWLGFESPEGFHRQVLVGFLEGATDSIDPGYDGKIADVLPNDAFFVQDSLNFVIQAFGEFNRSREIPITVMIDEDNDNGIQKFMIDELENIDDNIEIYIKDNTLRETYDLRKQTYEVALKTGEHNERFSLVFKSKSEVQEEAEENEPENNEEESLYNGKMIVYMNNSTSTIDIRKPLELEIKSAVLYNYLGQIIQVWSNNLSGNDINLPLNDISSSTYILKIETNEEIVTKKVIIE